MFLNHIKIKITILLWYCSKAWSRNFELLTRPLRLSLWFNSLQLSSKKKVIHRQTFSFSITKNMVDFRICYVMLCYVIMLVFYSSYKHVFLILQQQSVPFSSWKINSFIGLISCSIIYMFSLGIIFFVFLLLWG